MACRNYSVSSILPIPGVVALVFALLTASTWGDTIDFDRDVRPILSNHCYACHGPDENTREADLRLDARDHVFADPATAVIQPGKPQESELVRRILADDPDVRMPPANSKKSLSPAQIDILSRWVAEGATWQTHWAWTRPVRPPVPQLTATRLESTPSQDVREATSPSNDIDFFIQSRLQSAGLTPSPPADRVTLIRRLSFDLLGLPPSPADVERFVSDTDPLAYEHLVDRLLNSAHYGERMAMYWLDVVRFADSNGYHSDEPRQVAPYRDYVIAVFNGNKPYDQFVIEQLAGDLLPDATLEQKVASGFNMLLQTTNEGGAQAKEYLAKYSADRVRNTGSIFLGVTFGCAECHNHKFDPFTMKEFYSFAAFFADIQEQGVGNPPSYPVATTEQLEHLRELDEQIASLRDQIDNADTPELQVAQQSWETSLQGNQEGNAVMPPPIRAILAVTPDQRSETQREELAKHFRNLTPLLAPLREQRTRLETARQAYDRSIPRTLMTVAKEPRPIRVLPRGNWMDDSGPLVSPAVPSFLTSLDASSRPPTRLDLARWIADRQNPLTARAFVNRLWKLFFGQGLAQPLDDLGAQGTAPSHPELLDWLAVEFQESGWDVKHVVRLIVTSATYRQTADPTRLLKERDPYNRLYARQSRFRLDAEMVRDNALAISGLLASDVGGPSVKPYQPAGYWSHMNFPVREWSADTGRDLYRRGLYTWWQRMFLHPSLLAFDAPSREECTVERPRSNTPQQALVLLNDPTYVEAARAFAERILASDAATVDERLRWAYHQALSREPRDSELTVLRAVRDQDAQQYAHDQEAARQLIAIGASQPRAEVDAAELATWTSVARVILNLHETITRP
ncbi:MAG: PSD1 domain-containing protein [Planctomycetales bacterium]|nr:PSD1 domain-containing protein [Planctomycetales bacterium]